MIPTPWYDPSGEVRLLASRPAPAGLMLATKITLPDLPDSELREFDLRLNPDYPVQIKDQNGKGACNGHAAASSYEDASYISGLPHVPISAWSIYAPLCNGWDVGSSIAEALQLFEQQGAAEESYVPYGTINPKQLSAEALANRACHKIEIGCKLHTFRDLLVAAHMRFPFNFSVPVNSGFNTLDEYDVPQNRPGDHNHAVSGGFALKKSVKYNWLVPTRNSWGTNWGRKGYFNTAERTILGPGFDAYCVIATVINPHYAPPKAA